MMTYIKKILPAATMLAILVTFSDAAPVAAQEEDKVVVRVNGQEIRTSDIRLAMDDILSQISSIPPKARYPFVVEYLIERHLIAQAAVSEKIAETDEFRRRQRFYQLKALRDAYFEEKIKPQITKEYVRSVYDREKKNTEPRMRARARHIVVATEEEAKAVLVKVKGGEDFAALAKAISKDSAAPQGGDLGYFLPEEMVPEFSKIVFALKPGDFGGPVKTPFGWHVIKVEDFKEAKHKPYEQVENGLKTILLRKKVQDLVADFRKRSKIELLDPDLAKLRDAINKKIKEDESKAPK
jgi:peptidyl-prolyl cis-trans isomerase C